MGLLIGLLLIEEYDYPMHGSERLNQRKSFDDADDDDKPCLCDVCRTNLSLRNIIEPRMCIHVFLAYQFRQVDSGEDFFQLSGVHRISLPDPKG